MYFHGGEADHFFQNASAFVEDSSYPPPGVHPVAVLGTSGPGAEIICGALV